SGFYCRSLHKKKVKRNFPQNMFRYQKSHHRLEVSLDVLLYVAVIVVYHRIMVESWLTVWEPPWRKQHVDPSMKEEKP
uniref:Uncharacterized protein n=1 Tax=Salvator merianae TaxID=96440 RepID=A0A8D0BG56_SALMN